MLPRKLAIFLEPLFYKTPVCERRLQILKTVQIYCGDLFKKYVNNKCIYKKVYKCKSVWGWKKYTMQKCLAKNVKKYTNPN